jgi:hypothetical protein
MKYKVTITSTDLTGHEDEKEVFKNLTREELFPILASYSSSGKTILIEPMPQKKKVTVWFYVSHKLGSTYSASNIEYKKIIQWRNNDISLGNEVSEIKSMEVEL